MAKVLTYNLVEPIGDTKTAKIDIRVSDSNLTIDGSTGGEPVLASGALQYLENGNVPARTRNSSNGETSLALAMGLSGKQWFRFPWQACNGATEWQVHINPDVQSDIKAHSGGGNVKLDFTGMALTTIAAETGGGNMDVVLPESATSATVKSGAGNVTVCVPSGIAARIEAKTGMGKVVVDPKFSKIDKFTYQSPDYDSAAKKIEITLGSGAGNVVVNTK